MRNALDFLILSLIAATFVLVLRVRKVEEGERSAFQETNLTLASDQHGNESLVVSAILAGRRTLFIIDTAYAGAPVLSTSFMEVERMCDSGSVQERFLKASRLLRKRSERGGSIYRNLISPGLCRAFTSGCTMRLMGIAETVENQADMLLCPSLVLEGGEVGPTRWDMQGDAFVSNPLPLSTHILTMDYILHRSPCHILPGKGKLIFGASGKGEGFSMQKATMLGGSFLVPFRVGGVTLMVVVDTGAATTLSLSSTTAKRVVSCERGDGEWKALQMGVNGEHVCSDLFYAKVEVGGLNLGSVPIFSNSSPVQGADAYAGMGLLRCLDMRIEEGRIGFRPSGLPFVPPSDKSILRGTCSNTNLPDCAKI